MVDPVIVVEASCMGPTPDRFLPRSAPCAPHGQAPTGTQDAATVEGMWAGILTFLFGATLTSGSANTMSLGRGHHPTHRSIDLLAMGSVLMGLGVLQMMRSNRRHRRQLAEAQRAQVVAAFREPTAPSTGNAPQAP